MPTTTKAVTAFTVTAIRTNVDGSQTILATVTYDDATTAKVEFLPLTVLPS